MNKLATALLQRVTAPLSGIGVLAGALCWLAALSPSLIPRNGPLQGAIGGLCFVVGYAAAVTLVSAWTWLGFAAVSQPLLGRLRQLAAGAAALIMVVAAFFGDTWQDEVRSALDMPPASGGWPFVLLGVGLAVIVVLLAIGRFFGALRDLFRAPLRRLLPPRAALLVSSIAALWLFWAVGNGVLLDWMLRGLDLSYRTVDGLIPAEEAKPTDPLRPGSAASLLNWEDLGREGRRRVLSIPSVGEISAITGRPAIPPLQVYVGLNSAESPQQRADLALKELERIGAFDRKLLVIATPTGTGWVDPAAMLPLEIMQGGDVASVSVQYSYLPSWLTLFVDPQYGEDTAETVFDTIYGHWRALPREHRPRLFLFGLSLGSLNSDLASDAYLVMGDPFEGALWVGPPFASRTWPQLRDTRREGSPAWLPQARSDSVFRVYDTADRSQLAAPGWGPVKIAYLVYPSDPISFFQTSMWARRPDWMKSPRGEGVSPALRWMPGISFIQLAFDMMTATTVPKGRGHVYAARDYAAGWQALTRPEGFGEAEMQRLDDWLEARGI